MLDWIFLRTGRWLVKTAADWLGKEDKQFDVPDWKVLKSAKVIHNGRYKPYMDDRVPEIANNWIERKVDISAGNEDFRLLDRLEEYLKPYFPPGSSSLFTNLEKVNPDLQLVFQLLALVRILDHARRH